MNQLVTEIKHALQPVFRKYPDEILFCYCFGSYAANETTATSDVDLAFFLKPNENSFDFKLALLADVSRSIKRNDVDLLILNDLKNLILAEEIIRKGSLLYETDRDAREDYEVKIIHNAIDFRAQRKAIMGF